ncbi:hypothetical protein P154DRAFT_572988 [Amniculicola lignicola CBS 123094]|uniref:Uncharacterized protein n=1 Tax=Amniculicola lignicola CBS 123094 TaxID=1392246 RepID=A0A6A5WQP8_9PLEO|nr:hypothetical protein P154DRAFT_572988 [Amniculicola lignicola CBS 123094]
MSLLGPGALGGLQHPTSGQRGQMAGCKTLDTCSRTSILAVIAIAIAILTYSSGCFNRCVESRGDDAECSMRRHFLRGSFTIMAAIPLVVHDIHPDAIDSDNSTRSAHVNIAVAIHNCASHTAVSAAGGALSGIARRCFTARYELCTPTPVGSPAGEKRRGPPEPGQSPPPAIIPPPQ